MNEIEENQPVDSKDIALARRALLCCPFCGDAVEMEYDAVVAYEISCCTSMSLQICDALEDEGVRFEDAYRFDKSKTEEFHCGEYPEVAKRVCRDHLAKAWNSRHNA